MPSSGMLRRVALERTDVSEDCSSSIIRVTGIGELGTLAVNSNRRTLRRNAANIVPSSPILVTLMLGALISSETSVLTRSKLSNISEDGILQQSVLRNKVPFEGEINNSIRGHTSSAASCMRPNRKQRRECQPRHVQSLHWDSGRTVAVNCRKEYPSLRQP
jgi:hypothetical protein